MTEPKSPPAVWIDELCNISEEMAGRILDDQLLYGLSAIRIDGLMIERIDPFELMLPKETKSLDEMPKPVRYIDRDWARRRWPVPR
jgi:hypothetical protein